MTSVDNHLRPAKVLAFLFVGLLCLTGCAEKGPEVVRLQGSIYGTGWSVTYLHDEQTPPEADIKAALLDAFDVVNRSMNTYDPSSTISQFNASPVGEPFELDWDFAYVFNEAKKINALSGGAYDVTLSPLLDLWGFGPNGPRLFPTEDAILAAKDNVGFEHFSWTPETRTLSKHREGVSLELSSIAKGYGVDLGADALDELGVRNFMLDIGGEIQLRGHSPRMTPWRIAVERPDKGDFGVQAAIEATDVGIATSGDYRNYFEHEGQLYSHVIDPRTGNPIRHDLVSVTVVHPSTTLADAWATALLVVGAEQAMDIAEKQRLAVYLVSRRQGEFVVFSTSAFEPYLATNVGDV